jgi:replicative DNA helicase
MKTAERASLAPHSIEAEEAVIGAVLIAAVDVLPALLVNLTPQTFFDLKHQWLWRAISDIAARDGAEAVDALTVINELRAQKRLDDVGGMAGVMEIANRTPTYLHAAHYGEIVRLAAVRRALLAASTRLAALAGDETLTTEEALGRAQVEVGSVVQHGMRRSFQPGADVFGAALANMENWYADPADVRGFKTGLPTLDRITCGLKRGQLVQVGGVTSMGKSMFVRGLIRRLLPQGRLLWATTEMRADVSALMLAAEACGLTYREVERGRLTEEQYIALSRKLAEYRSLAERGLVFMPDGVNDVRSLAAMADMLSSQRDGLAAIIVDSASKMSDGVPGRTIFDRVTAVSNALQNIAVQKNVLVIATWQFGRNPSKDNEYVPTLSDIKGSGAPEEDADLFLALYRRDYYVQRGLLAPSARFPAQTAALMILKDRYGGDGSAMLTLGFVPGKGMFEIERTS